jgi:TPR repeat protein
MGGVQSRSFPCTCSRAVSTVECTPPYSLAHRPSRLPCRYLRRAAEAGDADSMAHLGHIYANGIGQPRDNATAMTWFWKAAENGGLVSFCLLF